MSTVHIRQINLGDEGMPEKITAELSLSEAVFIALLMGQQNGHTSEEILPGGTDLPSEIYSALTGELFNRYYDDGVDEAARGLAS